jgi:glycosyltransferase involved in cell wall biosynthesis
MEFFSPANIDEQKKEDLKKRLGILKEDFIISYLGSIGGWYLTVEMMQFCKILSDKIPSTKLLFISPHRHDEIRMAAQQHGIAANKIIIEKAGRQQVPLLLSLSDYSVFFIKPCYSKQSSSPTKHGEIMAMGIPLITNSGVGDVEMIVKKYNSGIVINEFNEQEFTNAALKIATAKDYNADEIRQGAAAFYSLDTAIEKYISIYNNMLQ